MTTTTDYALMAGASYISTRNVANRFPAPQGWTEVEDLRKNDPKSGFEATIFKRGSEIVISYSGTDPNNSSLFTSPDGRTNAALAAGNWSDQLLQAAEYYLQIKDANPPGARITLTGHSLGGGLAALVGVFFGVQAQTFDQAPFALSAGDLRNDNATDLRLRLAAKRDSAGNRLYNDTALLGLTEYLQLRSAGNASTFIPRADLVNTIRVEGEFLNGGLAGHRPIGNAAVVLTHGPAEWFLSSFDLHSQALLTAFLQSDKSAASSSNPQQTLSEASKKLTDLLSMLFDKKLFATDSATDKKNILDHLVRHEAGVQGSFAPDAMVIRFTKDLWALAQDGGFSSSQSHQSLFHSGSAARTGGKRG